MIPLKSIKILTGKTCPAGGLWESMGNFRTTITMMKGQRMPAYCGVSVYWKLIIEQ